MPEPSDLVRVRHENGSETTVSREWAETVGLPIAEGKPAVDSFGRPLPEKSRLGLKSEAKQFNPTAHTVAEVIEYLDAADADEAARVVDAEAGNKARSGIVNWSPAGIDSNPTEEK